jgi:uncharacterized damage-inducible protein DinB
MNQVVGLLKGALEDLERVLDGVDERLAMEQIDGGSAIAWTVAHLAGNVDSWINVRFAGERANEVVSGDHYRAGAEGAAPDWANIKNAAANVRARALAYLAGIGDEALDRRIEYTGSIQDLRERGFNLRYALLRICAHHYYHIGEIATVRKRLGHDVGDYPGRLGEVI